MSQFYEQQKGWNKAWSHTQCPQYCHCGPINIFHQTNLTNHYHVVTQAKSNQVELQSHTDNSLVQNGGSQASSDCRKKGTWTEDEHRLFLFGLDKYGKGAWKSISRHVLPSKTPTQVASHAQKYFLRQKAKEKKRRSIHDITLSDKDMVHHHIDQK